MHAWTSCYPPNKTIFNNTITPYFNYLFYHVLERQIGSMLYERTMLSNEKHKELITRSNGLAALGDAYVFEFLNLEEPDKERGCDR